MHSRLLPCHLQGRRFEGVAVHRKHCTATAHEGPSDGRIADCDFHQHRFILGSAVPPNIVILRLASWMCQPTRKSPEMLQTQLQQGYW